jgi:hypothetical protein
MVVFTSYEAAGIGGYCQRTIMGASVCCRPDPLEPAVGGMVAHVG